jgi:hypothetical protein
VAGAGALEEQRHQLGQVLAPLPQRRQVHLDHREPVVQVAAEAALGDLADHVAVGRGHHPHVVALGLARAERDDLAGLEHAQELGLQRDRQVADLVEEQRAAVGRGERALAIAGGAGERAAHVAEQIALDQRVGGGAAVEHHERRVLARALVVDRPGRQLLAAAALAEEQDRRVAADAARSSTANTWRIDGLCARFASGSTPASNQGLEPRRRRSANGAPAIGAAMWATVVNTLSPSPKPKKDQASQIATGAKSELVQAESPVGSLRSLRRKSTRSEATSDATTRPAKKLTSSIATSQSSACPKVSADTPPPSPRDASPKDSVVKAHEVRKGPLRVGRIQGVKSLFIGASGGEPSYAARGRFIPWRAR